MEDVRLDLCRHAAAALLPRDGPAGDPGRAPTRRSCTLGVLGALPSTLTVATTRSLAIAANVQEIEMHALDHVPLGAKLVTLVGHPCPPVWPLFRNSHIPSMALARREAFANDQWAIEGPNLLQVTYRQAGEFRVDPSQIVRDLPVPRLRGDRRQRCSRQFPREHFDYLWMIDPPQFDPKYVEGLQPVWRNEPVDPLSDPAMTALSIVVPCYNEQECLAELHERLSKAARASAGEDYELVLVNDGSRDDSWR